MTTQRYIYNKALFYVSLVYAVCIVVLCCMPTKIHNGTKSDEKAPRIDAVIMTIKSTTLLGVSWVTDEAARSKVLYGTSSHIMATSSTVLQTSHSFDIPILSTSTPEHIILQSTDTAGNTRTSAEYSFFLPF